MLLAPSPHCLALCLLLSLPPVAATGTLDLRIKDQERLPEDERIPAQVISPIFRSYVAPLASGPGPSHDSADDGQEQAARRAAAQARQAEAGGAYCLNRTGDDSPGGGVRWSLNEGFGFYVQGKNFKHLQRLLKHNDVSNICPPGDDSPVCRSMPRRYCD